jgi:hypothetical protein
MEIYPPSRLISLQISKYIKDAADAAGLFSGKCPNINQVASAASLKVQYVEN